MNVKSISTDIKSKEFFAIKNILNTIDNTDDNIL